MVKRAGAYVTRDTLEVKTGEWLSTIRSLFPARPHLSVVPARCALLVVDMLNYFASPDGRAYLPASDAITFNIARLLHAWRREAGGGGAVVFTRHCHEGEHDLGMLGRFFSDHIRCGYPEAEIVDELAPESHELVVRKTTYDAFHDTGLQGKLNALGIDQVLITGVLTNLCCESTARSAFVRGFEVYVPADATASATELLHTGSLLGLAHGVAVVMSTEEVLSKCDERGS